MTDTTRAIPEPVDPVDDEALDPFRWRLAHRPDVRFGHAAGGAAGVLVTAAVVAFVAAITDDDPTVPGVLLTLVLLVAAVLGGWRTHGPARSAAVTAVVTGIPLLWLFAVVGDGSDVGRSDFRLLLILSLLTYAAFYAFTWTRGRAVFLGLALLFLSSWLLFEVADSPTPRIGIDTSGPGDILEPSGFVGSGDSTTETAVMAILIGIVLLGAGVLLDRRRLAGAATPCLLVGGINGVIGAITLGEDIDSTYATGIFLLVAGLAIGLAGSLGRRRGTSWLGAIVLLAGAVTVIGQATDDIGSDGGDTAAWLFGLFALIGAAVLLIIAFVIVQRLDEPIDGGEPLPPVPPAPAPPTVPPAPPTVTVPPPSPAQPVGSTPPVPPAPSPSAPPPPAAPSEPTTPTTPTTPPPPPEP